jgi:hypothetical protein
MVTRTVWGLEAKNELQNVAKPLAQSLVRENKRLADKWHASFTGDGGPGVGLLRSVDLAAGAVARASLAVAAGLVAAGTSPEGLLETTKVGVCGEK